MRRAIQIGHIRHTGAWLSLLLLLLAADVRAQDSTRSSFEIYGFAMLDAIYDFNQNNPDWFDVMRPSRLPAFENQFGKDGRSHLSARQSRFGVKATVPTSGGPLKTQFEFDMFGVGADAGQHTIRLRHAWGQWKQIGAGQTNSVFMDIDVFPNVVEYWGPNGMLFLRTPQLFWRPIDGDSRLSIAIEAPGVSGDGGIYADRVELEDVVPRFPAPDLTAEFHWGQSWGYVELGAIGRYIKHDDLLDDNIDLDGAVWGWGGSLSSNIKPGKRDVIRLQAVYGEGIENYFNDAPIDVAIRIDSTDTAEPIKGDALPILGLVAWLDHNWSDKWSTSIGYSRVDIDNSNGQTADAYKTGQYASVNLLWVPVEKVLMGGEFQWGQRENNSDGFTVDDFRLQFSFKYNFNVTIGG